MFFGKRILPLILLAFLGFGLLNLIRSSAYEAGWAQGFYAGQTAVSEDGAPAQTPPYGHGRPPGPGWGWGFSPFWGIGLFFKFLLFLFLFGLIGRLFFFHHKGRGHGPWGRPGDSWKHRGHHGHTPPWAWDQDDEEPVMKA